MRLIPRCATKMKSEWDIESAIATYNVEGWGEGYFTVNSSGNVEARPLQDNGGSIDILAVVNEARERNLGFPLLIRFQDLLRHRVESINRAFQSAISEFGYRNQYRGVFPIKVNQLREVIEEIVDAGEQFHFGLEAGSKPELVAALAMQKDPESLIICNGYKDPAFIRIALLGRKLGKSVIIVAEKLEELEQIIRASKEVGVEPNVERGWSDTMPQAPAFPRWIAGAGHFNDQTCCPRRGTLLRKALQTWASTRVPRCRRWPRRGLRWI